MENLLHHPAALKEETKMNRTVLATIAGLFLFSTAAMAQVEQASQITVQGTALIANDSTSDSGSISRHETKSGGFLVGYSYQFNSWAGLEGNYGYTRNIQNYSGTAAQSSVQADIHELLGSFVVHIPAKVSHVRPYVLAGAGALIFDPTDQSIGNGVARQTKAAFVYGGGLNYDITRNFGVRAEYRGLVYNVPDFTVSSLHLDRVTHLAQPSVGFYFRF
jgi:opacity protein-like surface antigen